MKKNTLRVVVSLFCVLLLSLSIAASAENYSDVYGKTTTRIRVRDAASSSSTITDNLVSNACVYVLSTRISGDTTFCYIRYRASDGSLQNGWVAQQVGSSTYLKILSNKDAKSKYGVSNGSLSSRRVGTFTMKKKTTSPTATPASDNNQGLSASEVKTLQTQLKELGLYSGSITGNIGSKTTAAIKSFQKKYGLSADGVPGTKTLQKLDSVYTSWKKSSTTAKSSTSTPAPVVNVSGKVYSLDWFTAKNNGIFKKIGLTTGNKGTLMDLRTGKSLNIKVQTAGNHLDVEPATASDTKVLCSIFDVTQASDLPYFRRPMLLTTSAGYKFVCSIYAVPHGDDTINNNNFEGQFCLHFQNSKTHGSNKVDGDHMAAIKEAISLINKTVTLLQDL